MCESPEPEKDKEKFGMVLTLLREINAKYMSVSPVGPWCFGESISIVDIAFLPFLVRFYILFPLYRGFQPLLPVRDLCTYRVCEVLWNAHFSVVCLSNVPDFFVCLVRGSCVRGMRVLLRMIQQ